MVYDGLLAAEQLKINKGVSDALVKFDAAGGSVSSSG
jgi:hypothetical protein